jgi:hypothetical protein
MVPANEPWTSELVSYKYPAHIEFRSNLPSRASRLSARVPDAAPGGGALTPLVFFFKVPHPYTVSLKLAVKGP